MHWPPSRGRLACNATATSTGGVSRYLGLAAHVAGRLDEAEAWFERATAEHEAWGARPWLARTLADHAELVAERGGRGAAGRAADLVERARAWQWRSACATLSRPGPVSSSEPQALSKRAMVSWEHEHDQEHQHPGPPPAPHGGIARHPAGATGQLFRPTSPSGSGQQGLSRKREQHHGDHGGTHHGGGVDLP